MNPESAMVVRTFLNVAQADLAAAQLRSSGIECLVQSDDAGGMYPPLETVKLLVQPEDFATARSILTDFFEPPADSAPSAAPVGALPPKPALPAPPFAQFGWGLLAGIVVGVLLHLGYLQLRGLAEAAYEYDNDGDGIADELHVWQMGHVVASRYDRNGDRRYDYRTRFVRGAPEEDEQDNNFDGQMDAWYTYGPKKTFVSGRFDSDFNGIIDGTSKFKNGLVSQVDWQPNGSTNVVLRELFEHGVLKEELRDLDGDGRFDVSVRFGPFVNPIHTNFLNLLSQPVR